MLARSFERACRSDILTTAGGESAVRAMVRNDSQVLGARMSAADDGMQPLHLAVATGRIDLVEILIDAGADLTATTASGRTAVGIANERGRTDIVDLLLARGAEDDRRASKRGSQPRIPRMREDKRERKGRTFKVDRFNLFENRRRRHERESATSNR